MRSHRGAIAMWAIELIAVAAAAGAAWGAWELHKSGLRKEGILIQQKKDAEETARANVLAAKKWSGVRWMRKRRPLAPTSAAPPRRGR